MTNKEIAGAFDLLAKLMELHNENPFKIKSYQNAYLNLKKYDRPLGDHSLEELLSLKGVGEAIAEKIQSLLQTGKMPTLEKYLSKTPEGVVEMLKINGLGTKKVAVLWKEHGFSSPGELLYACNENRLVELKGYGAKSQENIINNIGFLQSAVGKYLHSRVEAHGKELINEISKQYPESNSLITGDLRRGVQEIDRLDIITTLDSQSLKNLFNEEIILWDNPKNDSHTSGIYREYLPISFYHSSADRFAVDLFSTTGPVDFIAQFSLDKQHASEQNVFDFHSKPYLSPELRDHKQINDYNKNQLDLLVEEKNIRGIIHAHSTYSDGIHSLSEMADAVIQKQFEYLVITDHSKSSALARGLKEEKLYEQWNEIDVLNKKYDSFKIMKGIECDILNNGSLDYDDNILKEFDLVIASIHIAFQMDKEKATTRMIKAIENPYTHIIGHPSGRLILTREGYPLDYDKITDACKANKVAIELNANPLRLDLDYKWIQKCVEKEVMIAINPDAHNASAITDIRYGVRAARKGLLPKQLCLNSLSAENLVLFCNKK